MAVTNSFLVYWILKRCAKIAEENVVKSMLNYRLIKAGECSVGQQQMTEIVRNLFVRCKSSYYGRTYCGPY